MKRQLDKMEKKISLKSIMLMKEELKHLEFLYEYNELMVNKGLESNYREKLREYVKNSKVLKDDIAINKKNAEILNDQIKNGVEIIEKKKGVKKPECV